MSGNKYRPQLIEVGAMQLIVENDPHLDNAEELAKWCEGTACWNYKAESNHLDVWVIVKETISPARSTDWVVRQQNGTYEVLTDYDFCKRYNSQKFQGKPICQYCLADPRYTPQGDPSEKLCPLCSCRYTGPSRVDEYDALSLAGFVSEEG